MSLNPDSRPSRREMLRAGAVALGGLTLPALLKAESAAKSSARAKSVIIFCTNGGTAQHDSFDPKPDAPAEIRGPSNSIVTKVPGIRLNEHLPRLAKLADKFALVRSLHHTNTVHPAALYLTLCGAKIPRAVTPESAIGSREDRPHFGSALAKVTPPKKGLPSFVLMPAAMGPNGPEWPGQFSGFLGPEFDPYRVNSDPNEPAFDPGAVAADTSLSVSRLDRRRALMGSVSRELKHLEEKAVTRSLDPHYRKAFDLISSPAAQTAFDLDREPEAVRDRYGRHYFGQCCLLARRLVETGVRLVQINWMRSNIGGRGGPGYDTHAQHHQGHAVPADRPGVQHADRRLAGPRPARRDARDLPQRVRPHPAHQRQPGPRPLATSVLGAPGRGRHQGRPGVRRVRQGRGVPGVRPGHPAGPAGDRVPPAGR